MSQRNVRTGERASRVRDRREIEAELRRALDLARADYSNATTEDRPAALARYARALAVFSAFILRGEVPEGFDDKPEP